jgi:hypothetical protein
MQPIDSPRRLIRFRMAQHVNQRRIDPLVAGAGHCPPEGIEWRAVGRFIAEEGQGEAQRPAGFTGSARHCSQASAMAASALSTSSSWLNRLGGDMGTKVEQATEGGKGDDVDQGFDFEIQGPDDNGHVWVCSTAGRRVWCRNLRAL